MLTKEQMDGLSELVADATPGPWWTDAEYEPEELGCAVIAANTDCGPLPGNPTRGMVAWCSMLIHERARECEENARLIALAPSLAATVIEQQAEIERLRVTLGNLWAWCRNWDSEFIYDDEFDRSEIESALGATQ